MSPPQMAPTLFKRDPLWGQQPGKKRDTKDIPHKGCDSAGGSWGLTGGVTVLHVALVSVPSHPCKGLSWVRQPKWQYMSLLLMKFHDRLPETHREFQAQYISAK